MTHLTKVHWVKMRLSTPLCSRNSRTLSEIGGGSSSCSLFLQQTHKVAPSSVTHCCVLLEACLRIHCFRRPKLYASFAPFQVSSEGNEKRQMTNELSQHNAAAPPDGSINIIKDILGKKSIKSLVVATFPSKPPQLCFCCHSRQVLNHLWRHIKTFFSQINQINK